MQPLQHLHAVFKFHVPRQQRHLRVNMPKCSCQYQFRSNRMHLRGLEADCGQCTDSNTCMQCLNSMYLKPNSDCRTRFPNSCVSSCPAGNYGIGTGVTGKTCEACKTNYNACSSTITCTECASSKYLPNTDCVSPCPAGYYSSGTGLTGRICEACETDCNACSSATTCTECASSKYLSNTDRVSPCPTGYYSSGTGVTDRTCEACETNCN